MFGLPHRQVRFVAASLLLSLAAGAGTARAQIKHNDFTTMNTPFSTSSASPVLISPEAVGYTSQSFFVGKTPSLNTHVNDSRATLPSNGLGVTYSPLDGKVAGSPQWKSNFPLGNLLSQKMAPTPDTRYPQFQASMSKDSPLSRFTSSSQLKPNTSAPSTFTDAFTFHAVDNGTQLEQVGRALSLQDVNRYQFQGSFSGTPGLPVTHAGGTSNQASFSGSNLSNLTSGSKLFDSDTVASRIRSGGEVSPRLVTSDGTIAYGSNLSGPFGGGVSTPEVRMPLKQTRAQQTTNGQPSSVLPKGAILPSGSYAPTSKTGRTINFDVSEPEFIGKNVTEYQDKN